MSFSNENVKKFEQLEARREELREMISKKRKEIEKILEKNNEEFNKNDELISAHFAEVESIQSQQKEGREEWDKLDLEVKSLNGQLEVLNSKLFYSTYKNALRPRPLLNVTNQVNNFQSLPGSLQGHLVGSILREIFQINSLREQCRKRIDEIKGIIVACSIKFSEKTSEYSSLQAKGNELMEMSDKKVLLIRQEINDCMTELKELRSSQTNITSSESSFSETGSTGNFGIFAGGEECKECSEGDSCTTCCPDPT